MRSDFFQRIDAGMGKRKPRADGGATSRKQIIALADLRVGVAACETTIKDTISKIDKAIESGVTDVEIDGAAMLERAANLLDGFFIHLYKGLRSGATRRAMTQDDQATNADPEDQAEAPPATPVIQSDPPHPKRPPKHTKRPE